jgi:transketolase
VSVAPHRAEPSGDRQPAERIHDVAELRKIARELRRRVVRLVAPTGRGYVQQALGAD